MSALIALCAWLLCGAASVALATAVGLWAIRITPAPPSASSETDVSTNPDTASAG